MVEDNQIEAKSSPFAIRKGEIKVFDGKDGYVSMNQIVHKINIGHINDLHFKILEIVNEFEFITSRQLCQILTWKGIDYKSQDKLNNKLEQLVKSKILTRYYFTSEEGKGIYRIYSLEKMGKYLLTSKEIECKWQPTDNTKPVAMIKKRLSGNQTILAYLRKVKAFDEYIVKPAITAKTLGKTFKASGGSVKLTKNNKSIIFVFEVVRREEDWEKKLVEKVRLYQDFYANFVPGDSGFSAMPQLIFICEDEKHMAECFKTIVTNQIEIPQIKLYFSTDLRQNNETLAKTLVEFKLDETTNKYKMEDIELKLLD
ncbi:MAG: replication-relaxation family protein [Clostridia bacterium]|nr:replication-relaxation family protein [Clostridia bacterium]